MGLPDHRFKKNCRGHFDGDNFGYTRGLWSGAIFFSNVRITNPFRVHILVYRVDGVQVKIRENCERREEFELVWFPTGRGHTKNSVLPMFVVCLDKRKK